MDAGFSFFDDLFPILFGLIFIIILVIFITGAVRGMSEWKKNEQSPQLSVPATVKSKRTNVSHHHHGDDHHGHTSTTYYATFEFQSSDRQEFRLSAKEYGLLAENDFGTLTFQGSRFLDFDRNIE